MINQNYSAPKPTGPAYGQQPGPQPSQRPAQQQGSPQYGEPTGPSVPSTTPAVSLQGTPQGPAARPPPSWYRGPTRMTNPVPPPGPKTPMNQIHQQRPVTDAGPPLGTFNPYRGKQFDNPNINWQQQQMKNMPPAMRQAYNGQPMTATGPASTPDPMAPQGRAVGSRVNLQRNQFAGRKFNPPPRGY